MNPIPALNTHAARNHDDGITIPAFVPQDTGPLAAWLAEPPKRRPVSRFARWFVLTREWAVVRVKKS